MCTRTPGSPNGRSGQPGAAIAAHTEDIAQLAREIDILPNASAVRARLRPLSVTLSTLPERLKANATTMKDVNNIATLAEGLAERGDKFAAGGAYFRLYNAQFSQAATA